MSLLCSCKDSSAIKMMLYSSSFDTLNSAFIGVHKEIQANGLDIGGGALRKEQELRNDHHSCVMLCGCF